MSGTNGPIWTMQDGMQFQSEYEEQDRRCRVENALRSAIVKRWADVGVPVEAFKKAVSLRRRGAAKAETFIADFARASAVNGLVLGPQLSVFSDTEEFSPEIRQKARVEAANDEGFQAGRGGLDKDANPYEAGSPEGQAWATWWIHGVRAQEHINGRRGEQVQASRKQPKARGRPPKAVRALAAPEVNVVPMKRPRGRPRKHPLPQPAA